jgi:CBS domain-containing protein
MKVADLMAVDVIVAKPAEAVGTIQDLMHAHNIHSLPIVDDENHLVGVITSTDLVPGFSQTIPVSRIMSTEVHTLSPVDDVSTAARMMTEQRLHHIVVTEGKKVVGIISSLDLLRLVEEDSPEA